MNSQKWTQGFGHDIRIFYYCSEGTLISEWLFPGWFYETVSHICDEYNANSLCSYKKDHNSKFGFMHQVPHKNDGMIEIHHISIPLETCLATIRGFS